MTLLLPDGSEHPPAVPNIDEWSEAQRAALYEFTANLVAIKQTSKLIGKIVMWLSALAALIYYLLNVKHLLAPVEAVLKGQ